MAKLANLMNGSFELYGHNIKNGRPNIDFGDAPGSSGAMRRNAARKEEIQKKAKRKKSGDSPEAAGEHASALNPYRAILAKGTEYARNASTYIKASRSGEYTSFSHLGPPALRAQVDALATMSAAPNFNPELTEQTQPYAWQAHHMIPGEAFYTNDENDKPMFDKEENFDILLQTLYDIDHGHNMIILPALWWAVPVHVLLQHPNNHNGYTLDVMTGLKKVDDAIDQMRGEKKKHDDIVADVFQQLKDLEEDLWEDLLDESRATVREAAAGRRRDGSWVRWKTQGGKEYVWPALW
jgi:hypothetical protein